MSETILSIFRHQLSDCPCGHSSHIGKGLEKMIAVVCPECDALATKAGAEMTIVTEESAATLALTIGTQVRYDRRMVRIVEIEPITKLWGRVATPYVRVLLVDGAR